MFVKYQLLEGGIEPKIATKYAACADLYLPDNVVIKAHEFITIPLQIAFDIPQGWCMLLQPRSSTFSNKGLISTTGIIDSDYKGTVHAQLYNMNDYAVAMKRGHRVVQVQLFQTQILQFEKVNVLNMQDVRNGGIGSTGL